MRALRAHVPTYLLAFVPCVLTCSRAHGPCMVLCSRGKVSCMLFFSRALCAQVLTLPTYLTCLRVHVPACLAGLLTCLTCLCAHAPTYVACVACSRTECVFRFFFIEYVLLSHLVLGREKPMA